MWKVNVWYSVQRYDEYACDGKLVYVLLLAGVINHDWNKEGMIAAKTLWCSFSGN